MADIVELLRTPRGSNPPTKWELAAAEEIERLREALEHATELLVDTWHMAMEGDPELEAAVMDARCLLIRVGREQQP